MIYSCLQNLWRPRYPKNKHIYTMHAISLMQHSNKATRGNRFTVVVADKHKYFPYRETLPKYFHPAEGDPIPFENKGVIGETMASRVYSPNFFCVGHAGDLVSQLHISWSPRANPRQCVSRPFLTTKHGTERKRGGQRERKKGRKIWNINKTYSYRRQVQ